MSALFWKLQASAEIPKLFQAFDAVRRPRSHRAAERSRGYLAGRSLAPNLKCEEDNVDEVCPVFKRQSAAFDNDVGIEQQQNNEALHLFEASRG